MTIMTIVFLSCLGWAIINQNLAYLSNIISIRDNGASATAKVVDVKSMIHYGSQTYTTYKYTIITKQETTTITLNHKYQLGKTIHIIEKGPSALIEGTKGMSTWDLYELNYRRDSAFGELFSLLLICSGWLYGIIKLFTYNWWM